MENQITKILNNMDKYREIMVSEMTEKQKKRFAKWYIKGHLVQYFDEDTNEWVDFKNLPIFVETAMYRRKRETENEKQLRKQSPIVRSSCVKLEAMFRDCVFYKELIKVNPDWVFNLNITSKFVGDYDNEIND